MKNYKPETIEEIYKRKLTLIPENIHREAGHFNVFKLDSFVGENAKPLPYKNRDYYKIMLSLGDSKILFNDNIIDINKQVLSFSNPHISYKQECPKNIRTGFFCIFNKEFFHQFGDINQYSIFQPGNTHIFQISDEQVEQIAIIFKQMFMEISSDYIHKYDVLRTLVLDLIHLALKMEPSAQHSNQQVNGNKRISMLFMELLDRQFPIDSLYQKLELRTASQFADQLAVHVNHLNRAIKNTLGKTTTQVIAERILQESKVLLQQNNWNISEIAFALGFSEVPHFNNFFKKHTQLSPTKFKSKMLIDIS